MTSKIIFFLGGALLGAVGTYLVMKDQMEQRIDEEVSAVKEVYSNPDKNVVYKLKKDEMGHLVKESEIDISEDEELEGESPRDRAIRNAKRKEELLKNGELIQANAYANTNKTEYNLFSNPPKAKDIHNGIDEDEDLDIIDTTPPPDARGPYVLETDDLSTAAQKFVNEEPYFDKVTLFLYDDGVLCSEEDEIITNIATTVGTENLNRIGEFEPDVVYIRNEKESTDYEVVRQYRDFADIPDDEDD